jgi:mRNA-degrading endonuclease YafQ of YafQ-DinJ toxin-antitoxin module
MKTVRRTSQFKKDAKRMEKRGKDFTGFKEVVKFSL